MDESPSVSELLTRQFYEWERRGRGWRVWPGPVDTEPPYRPFFGHFVPRRSIRDDGQEATVISRLGSAFRRFLGEQQRIPEATEVPEEPEPNFDAGPRDLVVLQTLLPAKLDIPRESFEQFLLSLSLCREPIAFELLGVRGEIGAQFAVSTGDALLLRQQLEAFFPDAAFQSRKDTFAAAWDDLESAVVEFGLGNEFMLRLASGKLDPFVGIIGALCGLRENELGLVQVLFRRARKPWAESIMRAVTDNEGGDFFENTPGLADEARKKISRPLYAVVVRIATQSEDFNRTWEIARHLASSFETFNNPSGNELIPLANDDYPHDCHIEDLLHRQSRRSGMLLNVDELIGFVHLPGAMVRSPKLLRETKKTKAVPDKLCRRDGILLGSNLHQGQAAEVRLASEERVRHVHVIGASGTGKSTLLLNLIRQDIKNGHGIGVLDPHGDLIEDILGLIPPERVEDVVLIDPSDPDYSVGFNILSAHSDLEKTLLASDLVSIFQRLSTSWGDQMGSVLQNAILAFLESNTGGTLADMRRFLVDPGYRTTFLKTVGDPDVVFYWQKTFPQLTGNRSIGPVLTRLETFLSPKSIRCMVSQPVNRLDFAEIMDSGKIFLAKLSQGQIGRENAFLLGSLLVAKFQQTAMSRQSIAQAERRDYWLYIDEFHNFITPSMAEILTSARKYRLGLTLAHQELRQLRGDSEVAGAVMSNTYTRIVFRVGDEDARKLADGFGHFEATDLQNLGVGEAIARVERGDFDFNLAVPMMERPEPDEAAARKARIIMVSAEKYGTSKATVLKSLSHLGDIAGEDNRRGTSTGEASRRRATVPKGADTEPSEVPKQTVAVHARPESLVVADNREGDALSSDPGQEKRRHQAIKDRIRVQAECLDYTVTIEEAVLNGQGRADVVLRRGEQSIACEISVTTTVEHEVGNVTKCLTAGFKRVAVICLTRKKAGRIQQAVGEAVAAHDTSRVGYYLVEEFISKLYEWADEDPGGGKTERDKPRKQRIDLSSSGITEQERTERERIMLARLAEVMKRPTVQEQ